MTISLEALAYVPVSDLGLARVMWVFAATSLEAEMMASLLPVPPSLPDPVTWCDLMKDEDRCLTPYLLGKLGRWTWTTLLLLLPYEDRLDLPSVCCWGRWLDAEERVTVILACISHWWHNHDYNLYNCPWDIVPTQFLDTPEPSISQITNFANKAVHVLIK